MMTAYPSDAGSVMVADAHSAKITLDDGLTASVEYVGTGFDHGSVRNTYRWLIHRGPDFLGSASDLTCPVWDHDTPEPLRMLETLGSFLGAYAEAHGYEGSENRDLFPAEVTQDDAERLSLALMMTFLTDDLS